MLLLGSWNPNCNYFSFYFSLNQKCLDLESEQKLVTKSTKNFRLVPQMHTCLSIIHTAFVTRKIAEMLRKW